MFGSAMLEAAIALTLLYAVLSLAAVAAVSLLSAVMNRRGHMLRDTIAGIFDQGDFARAFSNDLYQHPLIRSLTLPKRRGPFPFPFGSGHDALPAEIPPRNFAVALLDLLVTPSRAASLLPASGPGPAVPPLHDAIGALPDDNVRRLLTALLDHSGGDPKRFRDTLEVWFENLMVELRRRYTGWVYAVAFAFALTTAIGLNINTLEIISAPTLDTELRRALIAESLRQAQYPSTLSQSDVDRLPLSESLRMRARIVPIGPAPLSFANPNVILWNLAGTVLTAIVVAQLTPLWYAIIILGPLPRRLSPVPSP